MRKIILVGSLLIFLVTQTSAQPPMFLGGSTNLNGGNNVFVGYQITNKMALIADYYKKDVVSIDILYAGFVISKGFSLDHTPDKEFITLLYTPKILNFGNKWKVFGKIGVDFSGPINNINKDKAAAIFGIGLRWN